MANIFVAHSQDAGATFESVRVATDAESGSRPSLAVCWRDWLWLTYHADYGDSKLYRSRDGGRSWEWYSSAYGMTTPRLAWRETEMWIAGFKSNVLQVWNSTDDGYNFTSRATITGPVEGPFGFGVDRRLYLHLFTVEGSPQERLVHRWSRDGATWSDAENLTQFLVQSQPGFGFGLARGAISWYEDATPYLALTGEGYGAPLVTIRQPSDTLDPQPYGLLFDEHEALYLAALDSSGAPIVRWTRTDGRTWAAPQ